jgi:hypothetical protein
MIYAMPWVRNDKQAIVDPRCLGNRTRYVRACPMNFAPRPQLHRATRALRRGI